MKVLGINGSPKKEGNTYLSIKTVTDSLEKGGFESEIYHIGGKPIRGCVDCKKCQVNKDRRCVIDDHVNELIEKAAAADVIIIGSPVYFSNMTPELKAFIDRGGRVFRANDYLLKHKIGASIAVARRSGKNTVISDINYLFLIQQMIVPGSTYWNGLIGEKPGDVLRDDEGMKNLKSLAENILWLASRIQS
ncbi:MAG: flavodoxin family protein [Deltaproteobacteria bacterium]|jgi:multimeric flavodoxin WrbA|nr:flavodoxin family protein [Deltaproteobacteria bacterium]